MKAVPDRYGPRVYAGVRVLVAAGVRLAGDEDWSAALLLAALREGEQDAVNDGVGDENSKGNYRDGSEKDDDRFK